MKSIIIQVLSRILLPLLGNNKILVLAYHNVCHSEYVGNDIYSVTRNNFKEQMKILKKHFIVIPAPSLFSIQPTSKPKVIITFDDGRKNNYTEVFPILRQFHFSALFFVTSGFIGREGFLTAAEIKYMANNNMYVGSHSHSHADFGKINLKKTMQELKVSKKRIERIISKKVSAFAYPYGNPWNTKEIDKEIMADIGYAQAYLFGQTNLFNLGNPFRIPRFMVTDVIASTFLKQIVTVLMHYKMR